MSTVLGRLARLGFADPERAAGKLAIAESLGFGEPFSRLLDGNDGFAVAADPDLALDGLLAVVEALAGAPAEAVEPSGSAAELVAALTGPDGDELRRRLLGVLGASTGLAAHLARHPTDWARLGPADETPATELLRAVGADPQATVPVAEPDSVDALRIAYHRRLLRIAAADLTAALAVEDVAADLSDLAAGALEAALAIARAQVAAEHSEPAVHSLRLAVIGMGKLGGRELNYVSDVDVLFVLPDDDTEDDGASRVGARLAARLIRICSDHTGEGTLWPVDAALRPEGGRGSLVRTLSSYLAYYRRWAKTWEFQALLKARPVAGDRGLGAEFVAHVSPLVWSVADSNGFVDDVQAMRRRVIAHIPAPERERELKLGPGGLRDVEFAVQLLQLVHGRTDSTVRSPTTLTALRTLTAGGYVGRDDGAALAEAYRFLRRTEHRIQLSRLRRTHLMPAESRARWALGRSLGLVTDPEAELTDRWRREANQVRRLHEKLFYRPLLAAVARIPGDEVRLTPEAARARLAALGYADPAAALRHLEALTSGVSRRAAIQRTLLPAMLGWFADAPDPDAGLLAFRKVSDAVGATPWYLRLLRDEGMVAERLAGLLGSSRYAVELIQRAPEAIAMLADPADPQEAAAGRVEPTGGIGADRLRSLESLEAEMRAAVERYDPARSTGSDGPDRAIAAIRAVRRRELFRIAATDVFGLADVDRVGRALSDLAAATLAVALEVAGGDAADGIAVIGMGRLGGAEMGYGSDADVVFVGTTGDKSQSTAVAELRRLLAAPAPDPPLVVDSALRPEGRSGPPIRTLDSYAAYYARWSHLWEAQALLRAVPIAGNADLARRFIELADQWRYPDRGLNTEEIREIRRIKARVDAERLPRGADPTTHTKLGRGGLADVEWTVQLLQLKHGGRILALRTTRTVDALVAATDAGLIDTVDAEALLSAWRLASRTRNAIMLASGRASDTLPHDTRQLAAIARLLGYDPLSTGRFLEDYRRTTRRAHDAVDRIFWSGPHE